MGDVLVFLTGREEIERCIEELAERIPSSVWTHFAQLVPLKLIFGPSLSLPKGAPSLDLLPLYAGLTTEAQMRIFEPAERMTRKVVISTNIAEVRLCRLFVASASPTLPDLGERHYRRNQIRC